MTATFSRTPFPRRWRKRCLSPFLSVAPRTTLALALFAGLAVVALPARAEDPPIRTIALPGQADEPPTQDPSQPIITGVRVLSESAVRDAAGTMPPVARRIPWAMAAVNRIIRLYRSRGYTYARAWRRVEPDGTVRIDIDEGRMSGVVFPGASAQDALIFRMEFILPEEVFHEPTVKENVARLKKVHRKSLDRIYYRVIDRSEKLRNELGEAYLARELRVLLVRKVRNGWAIEASLNSTFGLVPGGRYWNQDMFLDGDRFHARLDVGVPYRRLVSEPDPKFTWVHGLIGVDYRFPPFADGLLVPGIQADAELSRLARTDVGLASLRKGHWIAVADLDLFLWRPLLTLQFAAGATNTHIFDVRKMPPRDPIRPPQATPAERSLQRYLVRTALTLDFAPSDVVRTARRNWIRIETTLSFSQKAHVLLDTRLIFQYLLGFGYHDLILRTRGLYLVGDVRFWDLQPLSSTTMRTFFSDRYWVRETAQAEVAFRGSVWKDKAKLGVFYDIAVFGDATRPGRPVAVANAFGPSAHFVFLDHFSLDVYYAFGFAPMGFSHNVSLDFRSVF